MFQTTNQTLMTLWILSTCHAPRRSSIDQPWFWRLTTSFPCSSCSISRSAREGRKPETSDKTTGCFVPKSIGQWEFSWGYLMSFLYIFMWNVVRYGMRYGINPIYDFPWRWTCDETVARKRLGPKSIGNLMGIFDVKSHPPQKKKIKLVLYFLVI